MITQTDPRRHFGHMLAAHKLRPHPRKFALTPFWMQQKQGFTHYEAENGVSKELEPFVVSSCPTPLSCLFLCALVRQRTMTANALRAALSELGIVAAQGYEGLRKLIARLEEPSEDIPEMMRAALLVLAKHWQALDADERVLEQQIAKAARCNQDARRLMEVPSVGPIIASTILAKVADAKLFRSGRDFAAWIGLTGKDHGTGGKHRPGRISKQGDRMLRALLISGASAHLRQQKARGVTDPWLRDLLARRPYKVAMVAFAAKTARIIWAMLVKGEPYRDRASAPAAA